MLSDLSTFFSSAYDPAVFRSRSEQVIDKLDMKLGRISEIDFIFPLGELAHSARKVIRTFSSCAIGNSSRKTLETAHGCFRVFTPLPGSVQVYAARWSIALLTRYGALARNSGNWSERNRLLVFGSEAPERQVTCRKSRNRSAPGCALWFQERTEPPECSPGRRLRCR